MNYDVLQVVHVHTTACLGGLLLALHTRLCAQRSTSSADVASRSNRQRTVGNGRCAQGRTHYMGTTTRETVKASQRRGRGCCADRPLVAADTIWNTRNATTPKNRSLSKAGGRGTQTRRVLRGRPSWLRLSADIIAAAGWKDTQPLESIETTLLISRQNGNTHTHSHELTLSLSHNILRHRTGYRRCTAE